MLFFFLEGDGREGEQPQCGPQAFLNVRGVMGCAGQSSPFYVPSKFITYSTAETKGRERRLCLCPALGCQADDLTP